jgi:hypothetical protein
LGGLGELHPAGSYPIETDEELVEGISFPVFRRTMTTMQLIADPQRQGIVETVAIDPQHLDAALARDIENAPVEGEFKVETAETAP